MAIAGFKPTVSAMKLNTGGLVLTGDNAGFCSAIMQKTVSGTPLRLESLTYILPSDPQLDGSQPHQPPIIVNLLMQLRAYCDQNNAFISNHTALQAQITAQLHQTLIHSNSQVRQKTAEIEKALKRGLYQNRDFKRAVASLEREVKKNSAKDQLTAYPAYLNSIAPVVFLPPHKDGGKKKMELHTTQKMTKDAGAGRSDPQSQNGGLFEGWQPFSSVGHAGIVAKDENVTTGLLRVEALETTPRQAALIYSEQSVPENESKSEQPLAHKQVTEPNLPKREDGRSKARTQISFASAEQTQRGITGQDDASPPLTPENRARRFASSESSAKEYSTTYPAERGVPFSLSLRPAQYFAFITHAGRLFPSVDTLLEAYYDRYKGRKARFINSEDLVERYSFRFMAGEKWAGSSSHRKLATPNAMEIVRLSLLEGGDAIPFMGMSPINPKAAMFVHGRAVQGMKNSFTSLSGRSSAGHGRNSGLLDTDTFLFYRNDIKGTAKGKAHAGKEAGDSIIYRLTADDIGTEPAPAGSFDAGHFPAGKLAESFLSKIVSRRISVADISNHQPQHRHGATRGIERTYNVLFGGTEAQDRSPNRGDATVYRRIANVFPGRSIITAGTSTNRALPSFRMERFLHAAKGLPFSAETEWMKSELVGLPPELDAVTAISRSMASTADAPLHHINTASSPEPMEHGGAETERLSRSFESVLSRKAANVFRAGRSAAYRPLQRMTLSYAFSRAERLRMTRFYSMISNRRKEQRREPVEMTSPGTLLQYFSEPVGGKEYLLPQGRPAAEATQYAAGQSPARAQGTAGNIIYRIPVSEGTPAAHAGQTETSGEDVLRMQTVSSDAVKGLNAAYSFDAAGPQQPAAGTAREITREQEERILQRIISDVNYNRMADELLIRIERRLRAERRKFGK